jgi:hypothetical protein
MVVLQEPEETVLMVMQQQLLMVQMVVLVVLVELRQVLPHLHMQEDLQEIMLQHD